MHIGDDYRHDHSTGSPKGQSSIGNNAPWKTIVAVLIGVVFVVAIVAGGRATLQYLDDTIEVQGEGR